MKMSMILIWYGRNEDFSANFDEPHKELIYGNSCAELMGQYRGMCYNHDCAKYTPVDIVGVYDAE